MVSEKAENTTLDGKTARFLKLLKRQPDWSSLSPVELRAQLDKIGNPFAPRPAELAYSKDHKINDMLLREYSPVDEGESSDAILYMHGGGFVIGSVAEFDTVCQHLAKEANCRVFSLEYRRAPETRFPGAVEDAATAYKWLLENREKLSLGERIGVCGDSAGGNLSAVLCHYCKDNDIPMPAMQMLWYPATAGRKETESRELFGNDYYLTSDDMEWCFDHYVGDEAQAQNKYFAPENAPSFEGLAPAFVITAGFDVLRDEGKSYADLLSSAGVATTHRCYTDMIHGFISFAGGIPQGMQAISETAEAFKNADS